MHLALLLAVVSSQTSTEDHVRHKLIQVGGAGIGAFVGTLSVVVVEASVNRRGGLGDRGILYGVTAGMAVGLAVIPFLVPTDGRPRHVLPTILGPLLGGALGCMATWLISENRTRAIASPFIVALPLLSTALVDLFVSDAP